MNSKRKRKRMTARYNGIVNKQSLLIDAIAALIGSILIVGPFALIMFNLI